MPFCNACGKQHQAGEAFCPSCGARLPVFEPAPTETTRGQPIRLKRVVAGAIDVTLVVLLMASLLFSRRFALALFVRRKLRALMLFLPGGLLALKDSISGKSIGKLFTGLMVINEEERKPAAPLDSFLRGWFFVIPFVGWVLVFVVAIQILIGKRQRLGDASARTVVISDAEYEKLR